MKREMRVVTIVFGSLLGALFLAVLAIVLLLPQFAKSVARSSGDPASFERTARKIATFTVPAGYRIASATDIGITQSVMIASSDRERQGFTMQLQGSSLPSDPATTFKGFTLAFGFAAKFAHCTLHTDGVDEVAVKGQRARLHVLACDGGVRSLRFEIGTIPGNANSVTLMASGMGRDFDHVALHALLGSIKRTT